MKTKNKKKKQQKKREKRKGNSQLGRTREQNRPSSPETAHYPL
jgi:hypothetical protein